MYLFVTVGRASPLPQAAHIRVSWVQREAQTDQEAQKQQDDGALQSRHGPEGTKDTHSRKNTNISAEAAQGTNIFLLLWRGGIQEADTLRAILLQCKTVWFCKKNTSA